MTVCLKCQFGTSIENHDGGRGGRRKLPYVYTEQGIPMLAGVLHTDIAIEVSLRIMRTFVEMRRFFANIGFIDSTMVRVK